jgi:hypothetical protein
MPGAGKSTLARRVFEIIRERGMPVYQHKEPEGTGWIKKLCLLGSFTRFSLCNPGYSFLSARAILASRQRSRADLTSAWLAWFDTSSFIQRHKSMTGVYLTDHGIFQSLWSIGFRADKANLVGMANSLQRWMPMADLVVVVEASPATIEHRLIGRCVHASRLETWLSDDPELLARSVALLKEVKETLMQISGRRADVRVLEVDNDQDHTLEANAGQIADAIQHDYLEVPHLASSGLM